MLEVKKGFIAYLDDDGEKKELRDIEILEITQNYVRIRTFWNILTIPHHRILKIKEAC